MRNLSRREIVVRKERIDGNNDLGSVTRRGIVGETRLQRARHHGRAFHKPYVSLRFTGLQRTTANACVVVDGTAVAGGRFCGVDRSGL